jgi:beta-glucosidase/6-phospho-beta-glucosidase/beta-galactosidase
MASMINPFFIFATGIENSNPTISGGRIRIDEMQKCGHYTHWRTDFELVRELGISYLRYGVPLHRSYIGPDHFDWEFADLSFGTLKQYDIVPIADLCHFGVPDWIGDFQNPDFPRLFARYARTFAERYPWIQLYTPVNEMLICALFSAKLGLWNEQGRTDATFVTALKHIVKANVMAMREILEVRPDALFVQSESAEYHHAEEPLAIGHAETRNQMRFLSLDLNYGRRLQSGVYEYLMDNGMTRAEYNFFRAHNLRHHCIMGTDYYYGNEHRISADGSSRTVGDVFGYDEITRQYYDRYRLPVMHTETNYPQGPAGDEAVEWLWRQWANALRIRNSGVPLVGFTWYSLTDQVDWDSALSQDTGTVNPFGLYDLDRQIRPVGRAYKQLIERWQMVLPVQSVCLVVPVVLPSEYEEPWATRRREWMGEYHKAEQSFRQSGGRIEPQPDD